MLISTPEQCALLSGNKWLSTSDSMTSVFYRLTGISFSDYVSIINATNEEEFVCLYISYIGSVSSSSAEALRLM